MGRRSEQRIVIAFPVVVRGTDSRGSPFAVTTETHDISCTGASLKGLQGVAEPGKKIEIECQNQKAWFRVQWASTANRRREWRVGVRCLEPGKYIWGVAPKEWQPDTFDSAAPKQQFSVPGSVTATPAALNPPRERRRFARHQCRVEAQITAQGAYGEVLVKGKITDISLSGCYVEMLSPLPGETSVELTFTAGHTPLRLCGNVCSSQEGFGMGIAFTGMTPDDFEALRQFAPPAKDPQRDARSQVSYDRRHDGASPESPMSADSLARPSPANGCSPLRPQRADNSEQQFELRHSSSAIELGTFDLPDSAVAIEALVRLLLLKGTITRAELFEELDRLKSART
ncbi:MAG: PilZ domain-containing protein [Candidatus Acidiferrales bacterium]